MIDDLEMDHGQRMKREKQGFCGKGEWSTKGPSCEPTSHQSPTEGNIMITDIVCAPQSVSGLIKAEAGRRKFKKVAVMEKEKSTSRVRVDATLKSLSTWH
jgi:hypothetical protein